MEGRQYLISCLTQLEYTSDNVSSVIIVLDSRLPNSLGYFLGLDYKNAVNFFENTTESHVYKSERVTFPSLLQLMGSIRDNGWTLSTSNSRSVNEFTVERKFYYESLLKITSAVNTDTPGIQVSVLNPSVEEPQHLLKGNSSVKNDVKPSDKRALGSSPPPVVVDLSSEVSLASSYSSNSVDIQKKHHVEETLSSSAFEIVATDTYQMPPSGADTLNANVSAIDSTSNNSVYTSIVDSARVAPGSFSGTNVGDKDSTVLVNSTLLRKDAPSSVPSWRIALELANKRKQAGLSISSSEIQQKFPEQKLGIDTSKIKTLSKVPTNSSTPAILSILNSRRTTSSLSRVAETKTLSSTLSASIVAIEPVKKDDRPNCLGTSSMLIPDVTQKLPILTSIKVDSTISATTFDMSENFVDDKIPELTTNMTQKSTLIDEIGVKDNEDVNSVLLKDKLMAASNISSLQSVGHKGSNDSMMEQFGISGSANRDLSMQAESLSDGYLRSGGDHHMTVSSSTALFSDRDNGQLNVPLDESQLHLDSTVSVSTSSSDRPSQLSISMDESHCHRPHDTTITVVSSSTTTVSGKDNGESRVLMDESCFSKFIGEISVSKLSEHPLETGDVDNAGNSVASLRSKNVEYFKKMRDVSILLIRSLYLTYQLN